MENEFKNNIEDILQINNEIEKLSKSEKLDSNSDDEQFVGFYSELERLLEKKESIVENLIKLKKRSESEFNELKTSTYHDYWQKIQEFEKNKFKNYDKDAIIDRSRSYRVEDSIKNNFLL